MAFCGGEGWIARYVWEGGVTLLESVSYVSMDGMEWVNLRHRIANAWRDRGILKSHVNRLRIHSSLILATETCEDIYCFDITTRALQRLDLSIFFDLIGHHVDLPRSIPSTTTTSTASVDFVVQVSQLPLLLPDNLLPLQPYNRQHAFQAPPPRV